MRFHVTSRALQTYVARRSASASLPEVRLPDTLEALFDALATRHVSGNEAKAFLHAFLVHNHILPQAAPGGGGPSVLEVFYRCLDRNLRAGISHHTLRAALEDADPNSMTQRFLTMLHTTGSTASFPMEIALAHRATPRRMPRLHQEAPWLASRKLDGVRCIVVVSLDTNMPRPRVTSVHTLSRSGRPLGALATFRAQLAADLAAYPHLRTLAGPADTHGLAHFVLDGELCALRPSDDARDDAYVEDFAYTLSVVRRQTDAQVPIVLFPFDCLPLDAFVRWRTYRSLGTGARLLERLAPLQALVHWCLVERPTTCLRRLEQVRVSHTDDVARLVAQATARRWEGLMLRSNALYEGRRCASLLKLRQTQEGEYRVREAVVHTMRLPVQGRYDERPALSRRYQPG